MRELSVFNSGVVQSVYDGTEERCRQDGDNCSGFYSSWGNLVKGGALMWQVKSSPVHSGKKRQVVQ